MIELELASEDEMILAFVQAEIDSSRFGPRYMDSVSRLGFSRRELIDNPNLADARQNAARRQILAERRGYPHQAVFRGFPDDVTWRRATLEIDELDRLRFADHPNWMELSGGTGSVTAGAANLDDCQDRKLTDRIRAVADRVRRGDRFPELIVVENDGDDLILLEGHTRAAAYAVVMPSYALQLLVGTSDRVAEWSFYPRRS